MTGFGGALWRAIKGTGLVALAVVLLILMAICTPLTLFRILRMKGAETNVNQTKDHDKIVLEILKERGFGERICKYEYKNYHADNDKHPGCMVIWFKTKADLVTYELAIGNKLSTLVEQRKSKQ